MTPLHLDAEALYAELLARVRALARPDAVLVDRGGRELPIEPAATAARVTLPPNQRLALTRDEGGRFSFDIETV